IAGTDIGTTLTSVSAASPGDAWAAGSAERFESTVILHWDGNRWNLVPSPNPAGPPTKDPKVTLENRLAGVVAVSPGRAFAVGDYGTTEGGRFPSHSLLLSGDGTAWPQGASPDVSPDFNSLLAVAQSRGGIVWTAGWWSDPPLTSQEALAAE